jgi:hypothetical protein
LTIVSPSRGGSEGRQAITAQRRNEVGRERSVSLEPLHERRAGLELAEEFEKRPLAEAMDFARQVGEAFAGSRRRQGATPGLRHGRGVSLMLVAGWRFPAAKRIFAFELAGKPLSVGDAIRSCRGRVPRAVLGTHRSRRPPLSGHAKSFDIG